jgi:predicted ATPase
LLEVASVTGAEFEVATVAAGARVPLDDVESACERLSRRGQFIADVGTAAWPDGTVTGLYRFRHTMYQEVLEDRLGPGLRAKLHLRVGARKAEGYGAKSPDIAARLARHFQLGGDLGGRERASTAGVR